MARKDDKWRETERRRPGNRDIERDDRKADRKEAGQGIESGKKR